MWTDEVFDHAFLGPSSMRNEKFLDAQSLIAGPRSASITAGATQSVPAGCREAVDQGPYVSGPAALPPRTSEQMSPARIGHIAVMIRGFGRSTGFGLGYHTDFQGIWVSNRAA